MCLLMQSLEAKILQKFFPLTGGMLSEDTYGFDISDKQPKVRDAHAELEHIPSKVLSLIIMILLLLSAGVLQHSQCILLW
jgi:hypothetical protein